MAGEETRYRPSRVDNLLPNGSTAHSRKALYFRQFNKGDEAPWETAAQCVIHFNFKSLARVPDTCPHVTLSTKVRLS